MNESCRLSRWWCAPARLVWALGFSLGCSGSGLELPRPGGDAPESGAPMAEGPPANVGESASTDAGAEDAAPRCDQGFATSVTSFSPAGAATFGSERMPGVVLGAPEGGGNRRGGTDVLSLGVGGAIVLEFGPREIVDGPGADFIVFENAFVIGNGPGVFVEPGEISVSEDGQSWETFTCDKAPPFAGCAGVSPVHASSTSGVSAFDPQSAGGDAFDLADVGLQRARFVRIVDVGGVSSDQTSGFDLDAIAIVHGTCR